MAPCIGGLSVSLSRDARIALLEGKVRDLRKELEELGFESSFFYRVPPSAKEAVAYLLIGETSDDVEKARADKHS
jgi:hypothetical protein